MARPQARENQATVVTLPTLTPMEREQNMRDCKRALANLGDMFRNPIFTAAYTGESISRACADAMAVLDSNARTVLLRLRDQENGIKQASRDAAKQARAQEKAAKQASKPAPASKQASGKAVVREAPLPVRGKGTRVSAEQAAKAFVTAVTVPARKTSNQASETVLTARNGARVRISAPAKQAIVAAATAKQAPARTWGKSTTVTSDTSDADRALAQELHRRSVARKQQARTPDVTPELLARSQADMAKAAAHMGLPVSATANSDPEAAKREANRLRIRAEQSKPQAHLTPTQAHEMPATAKQAPATAKRVSAPAKGKQAKVGHVPATAKQASATAKQAPARTRTASVKQAGFKLPGTPVVSAPARKVPAKQASKSK